MSSKKSFFLHASKDEKYAQLSFFFSRVRLVREKIGRSSKKSFCLRRVPFFLGDLSNSFTGNTDRREKLLLADCMQANTKKYAQVSIYFFRESNLSVRKIGRSSKNFLLPAAHSIFFFGKFTLWWKKK